MSAGFMSRPPAGNPARALPMACGQAVCHGEEGILHSISLQPIEFFGPTPVVTAPKAAVVMSARSCREFVPCIKGFTHSHCFVS